MLNEIRRSHIQPTQLAMEVNFNTIQPDIPKEHMYDGLHLSAYGVAMMETTIRDSFKKK